VGIAFKTPEEYFKNESPETHVRIFEPLIYVNNVSDGYSGESESPAFTKRNAQDLVIFCGSPGAGKSTFYWEKLKPLGYERVNQDKLKSVGVRVLFKGRI
jgi:bifunctional polynucleotide phosphatase/kinase